MGPLEYKILINLCPKHEPNPAFGTTTKELSTTFAWKGSRSVKALKNDILAVLEDTNGDESLEIHAWDKCERILENEEDFAEYDPSDWDEDRDALRLEAHVLPKAEASETPPSSKVSEQPLTKKTAIAGPSISSKGQTTVRTPDPTATTSKGNEAEEDEDKLVWVRLGIYPWHEKRKSSANIQNQIPLTVLMVCEIDITTDEHCFMRVNTWSINGIEVGYVMEGEDHKKPLFDKTGSPMGWKPDAAFTSSKSEADVRDVAVEYVHGNRPNGMGRILPMPEEPARVDDDLSQTLKTPKGEDPVSVLMVFRNDTKLLIDLDTPVNLQATFPRNFTFDGFQKHVLDGDGVFVGVRKLLANKLTNHWETVPYVLPQIQDGNVMYNWKRLSSLAVNDWLDREMTKEHGKRLYIVVFIVEKQENEGQLQVLGTQEKKEKKNSRKK